LRIYFSVQSDLASELTVSSIRTTSAEVKWLKTSGFPTNFDSYKVAISPSAEILISPNPVSGSAAVPTVKLTGLKPGVQYKVTVRTQIATRQGNPKTIIFNAIVS
jgi:hypothetical protein